MPDKTRVGVVTNPHSRANRRSADRAARLERIVGELGIVRQTDSPDALPPVLREFLRKRLSYWVVDGGDGALHCLLRAGLQVLSEAEFADMPCLPVLLPARGGTIDFVAKHAQIRGCADELMRQLCAKLRSGGAVPWLEVKTMQVDGVQRVNGRDVALQSAGFAAAVGGVGQRFFDKYYEAADPRPREIVRVFGKTLASFPFSAVAALRGRRGGLGGYAAEMFRPTRAVLTLDGKVSPRTEHTAIHVASLSVNLGNVVRVFSHAARSDSLHAIVGAPTPAQMIRNLPRLCSGRELTAPELYDGPCKEMQVEALEGEFLSPVIDGECYRNVRRIRFRIGPRVRLARP